MKSILPILILKCQLFSEIISSDRHGVHKCNLSNEIEMRTCILSTDMKNIQFISDMVIIFYSYRRLPDFVYIVVIFTLTTTFARYMSHFIYANIAFVIQKSVYMCFSFSFCSKSLFLFRSFPHKVDGLDF